MKYLKLITNKYSLTLTAIIVLALMCIMSTSELTLCVIIVKCVGFALLYVFSYLFGLWEDQGKIDCIKELFNDDDDDDE